MPTRAVSLFYVREEQRLVRVNVLEGDLEKSEDNKALDAIETPLTWTDKWHPLVTEYKIDISGLLTFSCYEVNRNMTTETDIQGLEAVMQTEANVLPLEQWDEFLNRHSDQIITKNLQLSLFEL